MRFLVWYLAFLAFDGAAAKAQAPVDSAPNLEGLWLAKKRFGPDVRGEMIVDRRGGSWRATISGRAADANITGDSATFTIPGGGRFTGKVVPKKGEIIGTWIQQSSNTGTPLTLASCGVDCYRGRIDGMEDELTFYLKVTQRPDGTLGAFLRNPERNFGAFALRVARIERAGSDVRFLDRRDTVLLKGVIRNAMISVLIPFRGGGTYDFRRVPDNAPSDFYAAGRPTAKYTYTPPRLRLDGWEVGTLRDVGIVPDSISAVITRIYETVAESATVFQPHALLIARHGKLVLEEYFHGEHADKPHNTRSASKAFLTALIGAAMHNGVRITPKTPVFATMRPEATNLDSRKQAMTLEDLLTMSAGLDCNDSGEERPGNENTITGDAARPDWYNAILDLNVVRDAGAPAIYCSVKPHLAGGVVARVAGRPLTDLMREWLLEPLDMTSYQMALSPLGDVYFGGGHSMRARDFLKLGQLFLTGGTWRGRRIMGQDWVTRSIEPRFTIGRATYLNYGYLWWSREYDYRDRKVRVYSALGNGGQNVMFIPDLDLVIATNGGNYSDNPRVFYYTDEFIPRYILPAVLPSRK
jgi:CubicO group peptidase (beta-lactamase class C family)